MLFPGERTRLVRIDGEENFERLLGKQFLYVFRPLHYAEAAAVEIVIQAYLHSL